MEIIPPDWRRLTIEEIQEYQIDGLTSPEQAAARAANAMDRILARMKSPITTAFLNRRS